MKNLIIPFLLIISVACSSSFDDGVVDPAFSHVRFDFFSPTTNPVPARPPLDTFSVRKSNITEYSVPVVLSLTRRNQEAINITYSVTASNGIVEGTHFMVQMESASPGQLTFEPGEVKKEIRFIPLTTFEVTGTVTFSITSASDPTVHLGMPGPRAVRKNFVLNVIL